MKTEKAHELFIPLVLVHDKEMFSRLVELELVSTTFDISEYGSQFAYCPQNIAVCNEMRTSTEAPPNVAP